MNFEREQNEINNIVSLRHSAIGKLSFIFSIVPYIAFLFIFIFGRNMGVNTLIILAPYIAISSSITAVVLSIIDLTKKNRKKILPIAALILGFLYLVILIILVVLVISNI
jgi:hypothetical protein